MSLLTLDDIAAMLSATRPLVRDRIVKRPDFPRPAVSLSQKMRRWNKVDVENWLAKQMQRNAR